jgi:hypothetical protein
VTVAEEFVDVERDGEENRPPPAARIAAAAAIHYTAGDLELVKETLTGVPPDELAEVAWYAIALAGEALVQLVGTEMAAVYFRSSMRRFVEREADGS